MVNKLVQKKEVGRRHDFEADEIRKLAELSNSIQRMFPISKRNILSNVRFLILFGVVFSDSYK